MPINDDKQNSLKALEIQCLFLVKELKQCLKKQSYREAITKCQKLLVKNYLQLSQICASIMLKIFFFQSKAVLKLLEKNVYKKYFFHQNIAKKLFRIINRNNSVCNAILVTKIKSKQILQDQSYQMNTYDGLIQCNVFKNDILKADFQNIAKNFCEIYLSSVVYQFANFKNYKHSVEKSKIFVDHFDSLTQNVPNFSFKTQFSVISVKLTFCKVLFENNIFTLCLKNLNKVIEKLLNLHFKIRLWYENKQKVQNQSKQNQRNFKKKKHYVKKVLKYLTISIILMVRVNMIRGNQDLAIQGIKIFNFIHEKSVQNELSHFKKYLNPEIYIYQQFCQYRAEKFQLQQIIKPLFIGQIQQIKNNLQSRKQFQSINLEQKNSDIYDFYNEKMIEFRQKLQHNTKKQQIKRTASKKLLKQKQISKSTETQLNNVVKKARQHSIKSKRLTRTKHPFSPSIHSEVQFNASNNYETRENQNFFNIEQSIIDDLQKTNRAYLTSRMQSNGQLNRWENSKLLKNETQRIQNIQGEEGQIQINANSRLMQNHQKSLKIGQKLIGNFFNQAKKWTNSQIKPKQIVKNKKLVRSALVKNSDNQKSIKISAQTEKLHEMKQQMFKDLKNNIQILKQKKNNKTSLIIKYSNSEDSFFQPKNTTNQISSSFIDQKIQALHGFAAKQLVSLNNNSMQKRNTNSRKNSSIMNLNSKCKNKLKYLNKKSKLQMFVQILTKNKEHFGVKKWSQKMEYIKKKQEMKEKLRSTRKTTSINMKTLRGLSPKMNFIAGNVLMYSLQEIDEMNTSQKLQRRVIGSQNVDNQNNYRLGMKSIEILMNKLEKEKQASAQNNQKQPRNKITTNTQRSSLENNKNNYYLHSSVSKVNNHKNNWLCKFVL